MGQSSELLWGFMNTDQIIYYFPVLSTYFPDNLYQFFTYFSASKLQIKIPLLDKFKSDVEGGYTLKQKVNMPVLNERWQDINYESTSILINGNDLFSLLVQNMLI